MIGRDLEKSQEITLKVKQPRQVFQGWGAHQRLNCSLSHSLYFLHLEEFFSQLDIRWPPFHGFLDSENLINQIAEISCAP